MKKINFEYTGVLYYYFTITKENKISNYEFKGLLDFVLGYLGIDKKYSLRDDVGFYFEYDSASISSKFAFFPYMWCGDPKTKTINKKQNPDNFYIGCDNLDELKNNISSFILTNNTKAKKHLQEAVVAYIEYKKEIEKEQIAQELNSIRKITDKPVNNPLKSIIKRLTNKQ